MRNPLVIITRTQPGADALAARLRTLGYETQAAPLLKAEATGAPCPCQPSSVSGVLVTSTQALRFLPEELSKSVPLYAVGRASAQAAREAGFKDVHEGGGDVVALGKAVRATNPTGTWLHVRGEDVAQGTDAALADIGGAVLHWQVYRTVPEAFDDGSFREGAIMTVHSVKAARLLAEAVRPEKLREIAGKMTLLSLSEAVLECLHASGFGHTYIADTPDEDAMTTALRQFCPLSQP